MRALAVVAFLMLLGTPALAGPFEGSDDYKKHFEVLGYEVDEGEKTFIAKHEEFYNVSVKGFNGGVLVVTFFGTTDKAKKNRVGFLEFLNELNTDAVAARFYEDDEGDVIVEGWYPGGYDRTRFGVFIDKFNEINSQLGGSSSATDYLE